MGGEGNQILILALQGLLAVLAAVLWFNFRDLKSRTEKATDAIAANHLHVAENYVKKSDFDKVAETLFAKLDKIDGKLDNKVSKEDCSQTCSVRC